MEDTQKVHRGHMEDAWGACCEGARVHRRGPGVERGLWSLRARVAGRQKMLRGACTDPPMGLIRWQQGKRLVGVGRCWRAGCIARDALEGAEVTPPPPSGRPAYAQPLSP